MVKITLTDAKKYAKKYEVDLDIVPIKQFRLGMEVELEHINREWDNSTNKDSKNYILDQVSKIVVDHLLEFPDYYERLKKMEKDADKEWRNKKKPCIFKGMKYRCAKNDEEDGDILPLEMDVHSSSPEFFDGCQRMLIMDHNAYDLVLIENASDVAKDDILQPHLETIMETIAAEFPNCVYLVSDTFKKVLDTDKKHIEEYANHYSDEIKNLDKYILTILALDLGAAGGHYAAYIRHPNNVLYVYDSMTSHPSFKRSGYLKIFERLGQMIFKPDQIILNACINPKTYLQPTGGFPGNIDPRTKEIMRARYNYQFSSAQTNYERKTINEQYQNLAQVLKIQVPESQDHFCFMWSLWFICANLMNLDINKVSERGLIPLIVIKRYIWSLIKMLNIGQAINHLDKNEKTGEEFYRYSSEVLNHRQQLFDEYFNKAWLRTTTDDLADEFATFQYTDGSINPSSIKECMDYSLSTSEPIQIPTHEAPDEVITEVKKVKKPCRIKTNF